MIPEDYLICPNCKGALIFKTDYYQCKDCRIIFPIKEGIVILLPSHLPKNKIREASFWNTAEISELSTLAKHSTAILYFIEKILPFYQLQGRFLEIGAGICWASGLIKKYLDLEVIASDISFKALRKAKKILKIIGSSVDCMVVCDAENLPFKDQLFDSIFSSEVLHHLADFRKALLEIHRVLKQGGLYIGIGEPFASTILGKILKSRIWILSKIESQFGVRENIFNFEELKKALASIGFSKVALRMERDWKYKSWHWLASLYYRMIYPLPSDLVKNLLSSSVTIVAKR